MDSEEEEATDMKADPPNKTKLTIGRLAAAGRVGLGTVRYYQRRGLLPVPETPKYGGFRVYSNADLTRLLQIKRAQELGFTLAEISGILANVEKQHCNGNKVIIAEKLNTITGHIGELQKMQKSLAAVAEKCTNCCNGACPIIDRLSDTRGAEIPGRQINEVEGPSK